MITRKEATLESPSSHDEDDDGCQVLLVDHAEERSELTFQLQIPEYVLSLSNFPYLIYKC